jgi:glycosyltransferase involved in cell wall biosynthesis
MINYQLSVNPKVMLLTKQLNMKPTGGRELLCKLNHDAMKEIFGEQLVLFELPRRPQQGLSSILRAIKANIDGLDESIIATGLQLIQRENVYKVIVDGSNLGAFAKAVKKNLPYIEVSTFFHNVEARFFMGSLREQKTLRALAVLVVNYLAERYAVGYSDKIICMSRRDSSLLQKVYGRAASHISPMALQDKIPSNFDQCATQQQQKFALFVGGNFYANRAGISWFVQRVVPQINIKICIVGHGFEAYRAELEREGKVQVVGAVGELADWYHNAQFVIAPIFDGSGMKTKVAEALMYGKKIVGTPEAFSGYEDVINRAGWCCASAEEFVAAIDSAQSLVTQAFYPELRSLYEQKYSFPAAVSRLAAVLSDESLRPQ